MAGLPDDRIADIRLRKGRTIELDAGVSRRGGRNASNGGTDRAVGAIPTSLALLQKSNTMQGMFRSISCKDRLELGLRKLDRCW